MLTLLGFLGGSEVKNPLANSGDAGDLSWIPGPGSSPGERNDNPFLYSFMENSMDKETWWATVHGSQRVWHVNTVT